MNFYFKKCNNRKCKKWKLRTEFHKKLKSADGLNPECKECVKKRQKKNYKKAKEDGTLREKMLVKRYEEADCWLWGKLVMKGGKVLNTKLAISWWEDKVKPKKKQVIVEF